MAVKYIVASGKGGAGKSSVTAGLSLALTERGKKVLCIDADIGFKSLDIIFNVGEGTVFSWFDIISGDCRVDEAVIKRREKGPYLLLPPVVMNEKITSESFGSMISFCQTGFDYIFIDVSAGWNEILQIAAQSSDKAIIVSTPDELSIRSAAAECKNLNEIVSDIRLVVNGLVKDEVLSGSQLPLDSCVDGINTGLIGVIPKDDTVRSFPKFQKLSAYVYSAFQRTAARIDGENIPFKSKYL